MPQKDKKWIELLNSYGPFNHGPWEGKGVRVTHEEGLEGRADFLAGAIRKLIKSKFTNAQLKKMTIADVGCYDGWILHQLSDVPFRKMVGIEPREKNILKGEGIRRLLGIKTRVKFRIGDVESLGREQFDIVLCMGVLHHLESAAIAIRKLDAITKLMLVLDTICLPEKYLSKSLAGDLELKDVIYQRKPRRFGLTGEKYESAYYDGSTSRTTVVSIPSTESLIMNLDILGYGPIEIVAGPEKFRRAMKKSERSFEEVLLYGMKKGGEPRDEVARHVKEYEHALIHDALHPDLVRSLYAHYVEKKRVAVPLRVRAVMSYLEAPKGEPAPLRRHFQKPIEFEIVKNMRFNPEDKIALEYGKMLYAEKKYSEALSALGSITQKLNADWRAVYRSFYLMHLIYAELGDETRSAHYARLSKRCHMNFPLL
jgi:hypothetical protein